MEHPIEKLDRRTKWWLLFVSLLTIGFLVAAALRENIFAEWRHYRLAYRDLLAQAATDKRGRDILDAFEIRITQNYLPELRVADRCVTCHAGVDDPRMKEQPQPFTAHPGRFIEVHPPATFGCTVCHQGQGRATETSDAHGVNTYWNYPLLKKRYMYTTCTACHERESLHGPDGLIARMLKPPQAYDPAGDLILQGAQLAEQRGCLGCHEIGGRGGTLSRNLDHEGNRTHHEFDFSHASREEPREVDYWLEKHFLDPKSLVPTSIMPVTADNEEEAQALTAYVLSLREPASHLFGLSGAKAAPGANKETGRQLYHMYCVACHGEGGQGSEYYRSPALNRQSDWYLRAQVTKLRDGVRGGHPADHDGALMRSVVRNFTDDEQIDRIIAYIGTLDAPLPEPTLEGDAARGKALYAVCLACHGPDARGMKEQKSPSLAGLPDWYIVAQLKKFKEGIRGTNPKDATGMIMRPMALTLADEQAMRDVAAYIGQIAQPNDTAAATPAAEPAGKP